MRTFLYWGIHLQAGKSSESRLVVFWLHQLHSNCWLLGLRHGQTSTIKWSPGLQWWHHLVNLFQRSLSELISVRAVPVLIVCCGEGVTSEWPGYFWVVSKLTFVWNTLLQPELAWCWERLGERLGECLGSLLCHPDAQFKPGLPSSLTEKSSAP